LFIGCVLLPIEMAVITLTTDFGTTDGYVGAMKGVISRLVGPSWGILDLAHDIPRGDIAHAAWVIVTACREFPPGAIHVVVVDPGVGGARRPVVVSAGDHLYVGPDNGVFGYLEVRGAWAIDNPGVISHEPSATFHGRDIFAPAGAALARGKAPSTLGPSVALAGHLPWGSRPFGEGRVVHVDHFGNLVTDLPSAEAGEAIVIDGRQLPLHRTYEDVAPGELLAYIGSARTVEIAIRDGRADHALDAPRGTRVVPVARGGVYR
jgi:S-adenosylmethionine hydrolase